MKLLVVLTQYKRLHLEKQLESIYNQTLKPDYVVVFQNENHINIESLKVKYNFLYVKSDYNTKFFGRFAYCLTFPVDICVVMDDDIIPGLNCLKNYTDECLRLNGIIGGNGRFSISNLQKDILYKNYMGDTGIRKTSLLVDFVGHLWCFKKEWLYNMFKITPFTYDTGEDMHLCFSSKVIDGIKSYACKQDCIDDMSDITNNSLASDSFATYKITPNELRLNVEKYFKEKYNLNMVSID
jgi:hypothetical protein